MLEGALPAVITCRQGLNVPRYANIRGIMAAKKPIETLSAAELAWRSRSGWSGSPWSCRRRARREDPAGDAADTARELARLLREEAKVL